MSGAYVTALIPQIRMILSSSDLSTVSAKRIRKQLVESGHEAETIKANRDAIDVEITRLYTHLTQHAPPSPPPHPSTLPLNPPSSLPRPLSIKRESIIETEPIDRKPKLERPTVLETDEEMAARLQREFDNQAEGSRSRTSRSTAAGSAPKKRKAKVKRKVRSGSVVESGDEAPKKKKRAGGGNSVFNKELILSDALADLVGQTKLSRPQVVKSIWEYVKERDLQDPRDKRYIRCDEPLKRVFHTDRLHMFTMNKILVDHVRDPADIAFAGGEAETKPVIPSGSPPKPSGLDRKPVLSQPVVESDTDTEDSGDDSGED